MTGIEATTEAEDDERRQTFRFNIFQLGEAASGMAGACRDRADNFGIVESAHEHSAMQFAPGQDGTGVKHDCHQ
jgi:hypothetical protein